MYFRLLSFPLRARSRSLCPATFQRHSRLLSFVCNNLFLGFYHVSLRCFAPASVQGERRLWHRHRQHHCCLHLGQSFPTQRKIQDSQRAVFFAFRISLISRGFSDTFLVGCLLLLEQTNSQSFWLFVLALLAIYQWLKVFPGLIGLASFVHCLIGSFLLASLALASLAHGYLTSSYLSWSLGSGW